MVISLVYGQIQTPTDENSYVNVAAVLAPVGYVAPTVVSNTQVAVINFVSSKQNGKFK